MVKRRVKSKKTSKRAYITMIFPFQVTFQKTITKLIFFMADVESSSNISDSKFEIKSNYAKFVDAFNELFDE